ncbi:MAG: hypothetical protein WDO56_13250 [Gammaproteobacteria bacterium]
MRDCGLVLVWAACGFEWSAAHAQAESCADLMPPAASVSSSKRDFVTEDLVGLRDIGPRYAADVTLPILALLAGPLQSGVSNCVARSLTPIRPASACM